MPREAVKLNEVLAHSRMVGSHFRIIGKKIGAGNFGEVRTGQHLETGEKVAIKIEKSYGEKHKKKNFDIQLCNEYSILRKLYDGYPLGHKITGIPKPYYFGKCGKANCMVLELLGPNLEDLLELCGGKFTLKTSLMIAFQLLDRIETIHSRGIIYRDIKPENFLMGRKGTKDRNIIHLVDYGLATFYRDPKTGRHVPYRDLKTMTGTARYMSCNSHLGKSQGRRDDLESIGYTLIYFVKGCLPWQGCKANNIKEKYKKIRDSKMKYPMYVLCEGLPKQFEVYMNYVKKMTYFDKPDYEFLKDLFHKLYESLGHSYDDTEFDWDKYATYTDDLRRINDCAKKEVVSSNETDDEVELDLEEVCEVEKESSDKLDSQASKKCNIDDNESEKEQLKAVNDSRCNVSSMSISEHGFPMSLERCQSASEIASARFQPRFTSISPSTSSAKIYQAKGGETNMTRSYSQGYFSAEDEGLKTLSIAMNNKKRVSIVEEEPRSVLSDLKPEEHRSESSDNNHCSKDKYVESSDKLDTAKCTEACFTEVRFSFLCFSWKRKRDGVTYHAHDVCHKE